MSEREVALARADRAAAIVAALWQHRVLLGDSLDPQQGLDLLDDASVDHVIADPAYSEHVHKAQRSGRNRVVEPTRPGAVRAQMARNRDLEFEPLTAEDRWAWARQFARIVRRWVLVFCDHEGGYEWKRDLERAGLRFVRFAIWHKTGSTPQFTGDRPGTAHEVIVVAHRKGATRWNAGGKHGWYEGAEERTVYEHPIVLDRGHVATRFHTTQKPIALMRELVADYTDPGDWIVDPCAGSGTTGVAARMLGRRFVGWEKRAEWCEIANRRIAGDEAKPREEQPSLPFVGAAVGRPPGAPELPVEGAGVASLVTDIWQCNCGTLNPAAASACSDCGSPFNAGDEGGGW